MKYYKIFICSILLCVGGCWAPERLEISDANARELEAWVDATIRPNLRSIVTDENLDSRPFFDYRIPAEFVASLPVFLEGGGYRYAISGRHIVTDEKYGFWATGVVVARGGSNLYYINFAGVHSHPYMHFPHNNGRVFLFRSVRNSLYTGQDNGIFFPLERGR